MILVTTTGKVGSAAARLLVEQRQDVRVIARRPEKAAALAAGGVEVVEGDLTDRASVDRAMQGVTSVVLVSLAVPEQELAVVHSAVQSGVAHVVKVTSKASADSPIARRRDQHAIEQGLLGSGLGWTLLRNNAYMQNFLVLAPSIAGTSSFGASTGDGRVGMVDARDVAAVAARVAAEPGGHHGATYWLSGPEALSYADAAGVLSEVLGRDVTFRALSFQEQEQAMVDVGLPPAVAHMNAQAVTLFADGDSDWVTDDVHRVTGRPPRGFAEFAGDHASAFGSP